VTLVLLLNKRDVLERTLAGGAHVARFFPHYTGPDEAAAVSAFFRQKFVDVHVRGLGAAGDVRAGLTARAEIGVQAPRPVHARDDVHERTDHGRHPHQRYVLSIRALYSWSSRPLQSATRS
jgi:hypothetical protein